MTQAELVETAHHDRFQRPAAFDRHASGKTGRVEQLQESAETVGVAVMRRGAEKESIVEPGRQIANRAGDIAVNRVLAGRSGRGGVGFVQDQKTLFGSRPEMRQKRVAVLGTADQRVRDDKAVVGRPGIDAETALLPAIRDRGAGHYLEMQTKTALHLIAPLQADRRGADHQHEVGLLAEQ